MRPTRRNSLVFAACAWLSLAAMMAAGSAARAEQVVVFAAASLGEAVETIAQRFEAETGIAVAVSAAGTSTLARQIMAGAPADVFVSADLAWMEAVVAAGRVPDTPPVILAGNRLVVIANRARLGEDAVEPDGWVDAVAGQRLALALVDAVPAGRYAKAALDATGVWDALQPGVVQADNVRAALALVATGAAPFGIVYATDAAAEPRVTVLAEIAGDLHDPIVYPAALIGDSPTPEARAFWRALQGAAARAQLAALGFRTHGTD